MKIHIESGSIGIGVEYKNSRLLTSYGWPNITPIKQSDNPELPLLLYDVFTDASEVLFDVLEEGFATRSSPTLRSLMPGFRKYCQLTGQAEVNSFRATRGSDASSSANMQVFFGRRLDAGSRVDQWYKDEREFELPGINEPITWSDLKNKEWIINGQRFGSSLLDVLDTARRRLSFENDISSYLVISHGDDHPGNVVIDPSKGSGVSFDPAAAGYAPASMADAKIFAHSTILQMAGMYYDPRQSARYCLVGKDSIEVQYDFTGTPLFKEQEEMSSIILNERIMPNFKNAIAQGASKEKLLEQFYSAVAVCALLVVDIPPALSEKSGRAIALLPAAIMLSQMRGLSYLEEARRQLDEL
jgi:hypothetical protein